MTDWRKSNLSQPWADTATTGSLSFRTEDGASLTILTYAKTPRQLKQIIERKKKKKKKKMKQKTKTKTFTKKQTKYFKNRRLGEIGRKTDGDSLTGYTLSLSLSHTHTHTHTRTHARTHARTHTHMYTHTLSN